MDVPLLVTALRHFLPLAALLSLAGAARAAGTDEAPWSGLHDGFHVPAFVGFPVVTSAAEAVVIFKNGSGFFVSADGDVLTNQHVAQAVGPTGTIYRGYVEGRPTGTPLEAFVVRRVATDARADLALYRASVPGPVPFLSLRDAPPVVGEPVFMVSHPNQTSQRVSFGHLLAAPSVRALHHDAATSWGSSGAPVLDTKGAVVGVHSEWFTEGGEAWSVGIPSAYVARFVARARTAGAR